jgi:hypothetical protein
VPRSRRPERRFGTFSNAAEVTLPALLFPHNSCKTGQDFVDFFVDVFSSLFRFAATVFPPLLSMARAASATEHEKGLEKIFQPYC